MLIESITKLHLNTMGSFLYQGPSNHEADLKFQYTGVKLADLPTPAAIIDAAVVRRNCNLMLNTAETLDVQFRAHIKTHKTIQGSKLQVGEHGPARFVVSTIAELELILPWLQECIRADREVNVLYGVPVSPSSLPRLAKLALALGSWRHIAVMVDHPKTLEMIEYHRGLFPGSIPIYIKIDTGYGRVGVKPASETFGAICSLLRELAIKEPVTLLGLYSHLGHSYGFSTPLESLEGLLEEFETLNSIANSIFNGKTLTLSVGATPTATAAQILANSAEIDQVDGLNGIRTRWKALKQSRHHLEIHAGVYPFLDMQQLATQARISNLSEENIGLRILVEVASLYSERAKPEALIAAGSLALGREPCKAYSGWGIVTMWSSISTLRDDKYYSFKGQRGWIVGRISQEHGILAWEGDRTGMRELRIGEKLLVWPNHACVAGAGFGWYYVVDSDVDGGETVQDVWLRCRGW
jgi:D-serine deaminase-like pyridoxal phosphate-dependent protein